MLPVTLLLSGLVDATAHYRMINGIQVQEYPQSLLKMHVVIVLFLGFIALFLFLVHLNKKEPVYE